MGISLYKPNTEYDKPTEGCYITIDVGDCSADYSSFNLKSTKAAEKMIKSFDGKFKSHDENMALVKRLVPDSNYKDIPTHLAELLAVTPYKKRKELVSAMYLATGWRFFVIIRYPHKQPHVIQMENVETTSQADAFYQGIELFVTVTG